MMAASYAAWFCLTSPSFAFDVPDPGEPVCVTCGDDSGGSGGSGGGGGPSIRDIANADVTAAHRLEAQGRYAEAEKLLRSAIALSPAGYRYDALGQNLISQHRYEEALVFLRQALALDPAQGSVYYNNIAVCYFHLGRFEDELKSLREAERLGCTDCRKDIRALEQYFDDKRQEQARLLAQREQEQARIKAQLEQEQQAHERLDAQNKQMYSFAARVSDDARNESANVESRKTSSGGLEFDQGQDTFFGIPEGAKPRIVETFEPPQPARPVTSTLDQLSNLDMDSRIAKRAEVIEQMKYYAACGTAQRSCTDGDALVAPAKIDGRAPPDRSTLSSRALAKRIPDEAKSDLDIRKGFARFQVLDTLKLDAEKQAADIKQRLQYGPSADGKTALDTKLNAIGDQLRQIDREQSEEKGKIKKRLIDLGLDWNEEAVKPQPR